MSRNIEFKARILDAVALRRRAESLADGPSTVLDQRDTFYHAPGGRIKLRQQASDGQSVQSELIVYVRSDEARARLSRYERLAPLGDPSGTATHELLAAALTVRGVVEKRRTLLHIGQTRVHLDEVEQLGHFVELEVVLKPDQTEAEGRKVAVALMDRLGVDPSLLESTAYIDLLEAARKSNTGVASG